MPSEQDKTSGFQFRLRSMLVLVAVIAIGVRWWHCTRASTMYEAALREYRRGSYDSAVTRFDKFLRWHPDHENVGLATARRNLSQIRSAAGVTTDPPLLALELAEKVLTPADALVGDEYEETMACLAERFVTAAKATPVINEKEYLIRYAERAVALIPPNYNPQ